MTYQIVVQFIFMNIYTYLLLHVPSLLFTIQNFDAQNSWFETVFMYRLFYTGTEILEFRHFEKHIVLTGEGEMCRNKHINDYATVKVVIDVGCGNTRNKS